MRCRTAAVLLAAALVASGCDWVRGRRPNVLLVVVDTLRADRLGAYGSTQQLTPFLDSLARRGYVFRNAYAQTSWTNGSIASLFTSRYQSQHGIFTFWDTLADTETTLAEVLAANGYATGGFNANFLVGNRLGFAQGFDEYETYSRSTVEEGRQKYFKVRGERLNEECLRWVDQLPQARAGVFLYLQYMEPHSPYDPPQELVDRVMQGRPEPDRAVVNRRMATASLGKFSDELVAAVTDYYDAEVMAVDGVLRRLFAALESRGFLDDAIVVVTADHGEELREHGSMGHDQTLYQESIHVPLLFLLPRQAGGGAQISQVVSLTDVAPTLLDWLGIATQKTFEGRSLLDLMGAPPARRWPWSLLRARPAPRAQPAGLAFSELLKEERGLNQNHERAVVTADEKLIRSYDGREEFYDLDRDPGEKNPASLAAQRRPQLTQTLAAFAAERKRAAPAAAPTLDDDTRERMRALGYAE